MQDKNKSKILNWKNWIIKKLLTSESTREEILNYIAGIDNDHDMDKLEDNNEKSLIKNIINLDNKSV